MRRQSAAGVDGCRSGWFYVHLKHGELDFGIASRFADLAVLLPEESRVFVDIPIGLIDEGEEGRSCDSQARKLLGPRRSSIFSPPCRAVLKSADYDEAREIS